MLAGVPYAEDADRRALAEAIHGLGARRRDRDRGPRRRAGGLALRRRAARPHPRRALRGRRDARRRLHPLGEPRRASRARARASRRPPAARLRSPPRRSGTGSRVSAPARGPSTSCTLRLGQSGEFGLLAELERRGLARGLDAEGALLRRRRRRHAGRRSSRASISGSSWTSWRDLGYKAAAVNLSDLAAMGAEPEALLVGLALPAETEVEDVVRALRGPCRAGRPRRAAATRRRRRPSSSPSPRSAGASGCPAGQARGPGTGSSSPARSAAPPPASMR